jgi:hypothetical protein
MPVLVLGAVLLGLAAAWFWLDDIGPHNSDVSKPRAVNQAAGAAGESKGSVPSAGPSALAEAPTQAASVATASDASMRTTSPQPDPFKNFLDTHGTDAAPGQSAQENHLAPSDPFKAALEESEKQRAAARASPFSVPR